MAQGDTCASQWGPVVSWGSVFWSLPSPASHQALRLGSLASLASRPEPATVVWLLLFCAQRMQGPILEAAASLWFPRPSLLRSLVT